ncbi:S-adenosyl-L-methionine-dependent methyltransferase [Chlamydoabsidia padenii]|nr:S-adenosyl-L-methionine-dependent methyltransferase [Chlamydoabsidia padenii]
MARSKYGLEAAGEWSTMKKMISNLEGKRVLDIGCGYGWHCFYAIELVATSVVGIDSSHKMLEVAERKSKELFGDDGQYNIEFNTLISSLALHYVQSFTDAITKVARFLKPHCGEFVFSVEHPIFTSYGDWIYSKVGKPDHRPVDYYFSEGSRKTNFLGCEVVKYHKTLTTCVNSLVTTGLFQITQIIEPLPEPDMLTKMPDEPAAQ